MKLLEYLLTQNNYRKIDYPEDVKKIVNILKSKNIEITPDEAEDLWYDYSADCDACWLGLPEDEEVFEIIIQYARKKYKVGE